MFLIILCSLGGVLTHHLTAKFKNQELYYFGSVNGEPFGRIHSISGLGDRLVPGSESLNSIPGASIQTGLLSPKKFDQAAEPGEMVPQAGPFVIVLERKFVTEPSLHQWAKTTSLQQRDHDNIVITITDADGETLQTIELNNCQPLSWTIEADDTQSGGFYEKISFAAQSIHKS